MYAKLDNQSFISFIGRLFDKEWSKNNHSKNEIRVYKDDSSLKEVNDLLLSTITRKIFEEMSEEIKILKIPTEKEISNLIVKSINNVVFGEVLFGELINEDLMVQIIKETLDITLKHELKDGNKRTAWFFFSFVIKYIYLIGVYEVDVWTKSLPILAKMNEQILEVSNNGNSSTNTMELARKICEQYRGELSILIMKEVQ